MEALNLFFDEPEDILAWTCVVSLSIVYDGYTVPVCGAGNYQFPIHGSGVFTDVVFASQSCKDFWLKFKSSQAARTIQRTNFP